MNNERENREWLNEHPALQQVNAANAFKVPVGYFDELEGNVMENIRLFELTQANPTGGFTIPENYFDELTQNLESRVAVQQVLDNGEGFAVPQDYFDELTGNIESRIAIDELLSTDKGFKVPENYFEDLASNIQSRIAISGILGAEQGFAVPENYFEELADNIQSRIAVEELMHAEEGFTVPINYFESLEVRILAQATGVAAPVTQSKPVVRKMWTVNTFKYATAACFSLFVGAAIMLSEFNDTAIHNRSDLHKALSKISKSDMQDYLELNGDAPTIMENADPNNISIPADNSSDTVN